MDELDKLKKEVFFRFLDLVGRTFVHVSYSDDVLIGRRGFIGEERQKGIVLVFNRNMRFDWDDTGIHATLAFGSSAEKCYIPTESIVAVFSPELGAQFVCESSKSRELMETGAARKQDDQDNVIKVDFKRGKP